MNFEFIKYLFKEGYWLSILMFTMIGLLALSGVFMLLFLIWEVLK